MHITVTRRALVHYLKGVLDLIQKEINKIKDNLGLSRVSSRIVPEYMNLFETQRRVELTEEMPYTPHNDMKCIISGDET